MVHPSDNGIHPQSHRPELAGLGQKRRGQVLPRGSPAPTWGASTEVQAPRGGQSSPGLSFLNRAVNGGGLGD